MVYRHKWCTGTIGVPAQVVYQYRWCTCTTGVPVQVVHRHKWCTCTSFVPVQVVYRYKRCTGISDKWHFNTSVAQQFYPIKITTTWNALPNEVVTSRTVNSFKNSLDKHLAENPPSGSNHRCRAQFRCAQTVVGQRCAGNEPNGLSYDYYYYYYYY